MGNRSNLTERGKIAALLLCRCDTLSWATFERRLDQLFRYLAIHRHLTSRATRWLLIGLSPGTRQDAQTQSDDNLAYEVQQIWCAISRHFCLCSVRSDWVTDGDGDTSLDNAGVSSCCEPWESCHLQMCPVLIRARLEVDEKPGQRTHFRAQEHRVGVSGVLAQNAQRGTAKLTIAATIPAKQMFRT